MATATVRAKAVVPTNFIVVKGGGFFIGKVKRGWYDVNEVDSDVI